MTKNAPQNLTREQHYQFDSFRHLYKMDFSLYDSRKTAISYRDLIVRSLSLDFIEVPFKRGSSYMYMRSFETLSKIFIAGRQKFEFFYAKNRGI